MFFFFFLTVGLEVNHGLPLGNHLPQSQMTPQRNSQFLPLDLVEGEGVKQRTGGVEDGAWDYLLMGGQGHWDLHVQTGHT